ncbi:TPA: hypothetical protein OUE92_002337 [Serratia marcescens]|nr:hypothetical protein [Serratia marcescens]
MVQRYNPDYVMHAARFEPFARENEHGEFVKFSDYEVLKAELDALEVRLRNALSSEQEAIQRAHAANQTADALAVENAAMRNALDSIRIYSSDTLSGPSDSVPDMAAWLREGIEHLHQVSTIQTPATDAALAAIEAQGVEKLADKLDAEIEQIMRGAFFYDEISSREAISKMVREFANELREAK